MKELFREADLIRVTFFRNLLEADGIPTIIRNEHLTGSGLTEIPIPEFFPALCVTNDEDYDRATLLIRQHLAESHDNADEEIACSGCGELNPGNFDVCWSCGEEISGESGV